VPLHNFQITVLKWGCNIYISREDLEVVLLGLLHRVHPVLRRGIAWIVLHFLSTTNRHIFSHPDPVDFLSQEVVHDLILPFC
jgi:hypothetical protein